MQEYFEKNRYKSKYHLGDRVYGLYHNIPFRGSVSIDSLVSEEEGPRIVVSLDLPLKYKGQYLNMIVVKHKDIIDPPKSFFSNKKR